MKKSEASYSEYFVYAMLTNSLFVKLENYILQLHRDLYKYTEKSIGGHFKISQNVIAATDEIGNEYVLFTPLAPYETPAAIEAICENYNRMIENEVLDSILLIPIFIHDFLCIHPFSP